LGGGRRDELRMKRSTATVWRIGRPERWKMMRGQIPVVKRRKRMGTSEEAEGKIMMKKNAKKR
jgi:hypothetical protein